MVEPSAAGSKFRETKVPSPAESIFPDKLNETTVLLPTLFISKIDDALVTVTPVILNWKP